MTCIAGLVHEGVVYLGGDSAGVAGSKLMPRSDPKVFTVGEFAIGFTTSFRMGQLLRFSFTPPPIDEAEELDCYMVTRFVDAIRDCFKTGGFATKDREQELGGDFLVGVRGRLFRICSDYQVGEASTGYDACGSGEDVARGALYVTCGRRDPQEQLAIALGAAATWCTDVSGPFTFARTPNRLSPELAVTHA